MKLEVEDRIEAGSVSQRLTFDGSITIEFSIPPAAAKEWGIAMIRGAKKARELEEKSRAAADEGAGPHVAEKAK